MLIIFVITSAIIFALLFFRLLSLDFQDHQARQLIGIRDRAQPKSIRKQLASAPPESAAVETAVPRPPVSRPSRAWVLEFATQMKLLF
ncbi:hypothetical protein ACPXCG_15820 [Gordonia sp. DT218]|uniref:hypothetical protein n=1 Tax=unclassified Gordonia (in: high G+C Gram-positive bacteria) TaxID=2657482 RepID=UPI003CEFC1D7